MIISKYFAIAAAFSFCLSLNAQGIGDLFNGLQDVNKAVETTKKIGTAVAKSAEDITPEQEYYIGRSVTASILGQYKVWDNPQATYYLNLLVKNLVQYSTKAETFGGYHVLILDSDTINAFGAPGGFILVTRGLLRCCSTESEVAAVLAHEIGHIENEHGLKAIKADRLTTVFTTAATEVGSNYGSQDIKNLTQAFGGSITDITKTLVNNGYSKDLEFQADQSAVDTLKGAGYNPSALLNMLNQMKKQLKPGKPDFAKTHPSPDDRIKSVTKKIGNPQSLQENPAWTSRCQSALDGV